MSSETYVKLWLSFSLPHFHHFSKTPQLINFIVTTNSAVPLPFHVWRETGKSWLNHIGNSKRSFVEGSVRLDIGM